MAVFSLVWLVVVVFWTWCAWKVAVSLGRMVSLMEDYLQRIDHSLATMPVGYMDRAKEDR